MGTDQSSGQEKVNAMTKLLNIEAAAELLSISKWTVRAMIRSGKLRPVRLGRRVLLAESELERLVAGNQEPINSLSAVEEPHSG